MNSNDTINVRAFPNRGSSTTSFSAPNPIASQATHTYSLPSRPHLTQPQRYCARHHRFDRRESRCGYFILRLGLPSSGVSIAACCVACPAMSRRLPHLVDGALWAGTAAAKNSTCRKLIFASSSVRYGPCLPPSLPMVGSYSASRHAVIPRTTCRDAHHSAPTEKGVTLTTEDIGPFGAKEEGP